MNNNYELLETYTKNNETWAFLRHKKTGLEIAYHKCQTDETGFSFTFKTPVEDQYLGTSHVLEHCVLQESKKYSVSFLELLKLACYSSCNAETDFFDTRYFLYSPIEEECLKLIPILADYVFFPELSEETFMQECIRVEFDEKGDGRKKKISGVIFNEMKNLLPEDSIQGGLYYKLHELTKEKIREYHKKYYRPDNCLFVLNGSTELETILSVLDKFVPELEKHFCQSEIAPRKNLTVQEFLEKVPFIPAPENLEDPSLAAWLINEKEDVPPKKTIPQIISEYLGKFSPEEYKEKLEKLHKWQSGEKRQQILSIMEPLACKEYDVEIPESEEELQEIFDRHKDGIQQYAKKFKEIEIDINESSFCVAFRPSAPLTKEFYAEYSLCLFLEKFFHTKFRQKGQLYEIHSRYNFPYQFQIYTSRNQKPEQTFELMKKLIIELADYNFTEFDLLTIKSSIYSRLFSKNSGREYFSNKIFGISPEDLHQAAIRFKKMINSIS